MLGNATNDSNIEYSNEDMELMNDSNNMLHIHSIIKPFNFQVYALALSIPTWAMSTYLLQHQNIAKFIAPVPAHTDLLVGGSSEFHVKKSFSER